MNGQLWLIWSIFMGLWAITLFFRDGVAAVFFSACSLIVLAIGAKK